MRLLRGLMLLMLIFTISIPSISAQEKPQITFSPQWSVNEVVKYSMIKGGTKNGVTNSTKSDISITVVGKTDEGYTLEWKYDDITPGNYTGDAQLETIIELTKGLTIRYTTDRYGAFQKVINQDEVKTYIKTSTEVAVRKITDEKLKKWMFSFMDNLLSNDQFINFVVVKEISLLHNPYVFGKTFSVGQQYEAELTLVNPFDAQQPFAGKVSLLATRSANLINIEIEQELDREKSAKILLDVVNKRLRDYSGKQMSEEQKFKSIEIRDSFRYSLNDQENWVENCFLNRRIAILGQERIDTMEFTRRFSDNHAVLRRH